MNNLDKVFVALLISLAKSQAAGMDNNQKDGAKPKITFIAQEYFKKGFVETKKILQPPSFKLGDNTDGITIIKPTLITPEEGTTILRNGIFLKLNFKKVLIYGETYRMDIPSLSRFLNTNELRGLGPHFNELKNALGLSQAPGDSVFLLAQTEQTSSFRPNLQDPPQSYPYTFDIHCHKVCGYTSLEKETISLQTPNFLNEASKKIIKKIIKEIAMNYSKITFVGENPDETLELGKIFSFKKIKKPTRKLLENLNNSNFSDVKFIIQE
jgi:hypothetical protein